MVPLDPSVILKIFLLCSVLLIAPFFYLQAISKRKRNIQLPPSPLKLPIVGHLHLMVREPHRALQKLAQRMGPVIYLQLGGVPAVVVSSPEAAKDVLKTLDIYCCNRPSSPGNIYLLPCLCHHYDIHIRMGAKMLTYNYRDIAFSPYSKIWSERRKLFVSELVGSKCVQSFATVLESEVDQLIQSLSHSPLEPINLNEKIFALIDGFIGTVAFGRIHGNKVLKYKKFQQVFSEAMVVLSAFSAQDFFPSSPISRWVDKLVGLEARYKRIFRDLDAYIETVLSQHLDPGRLQPEKDNLVDVLISIWKGQRKEAVLTKDDIKAIIMVNYLHLTREDVSMEEMGRQIVSRRTPLYLVPSPYKQRGTSFLKASCPVSSMSMSSSLIPTGSSQSKQYSKLASASSTLATPMATAGQALRPEPNGRSSKFEPLKSTWLSSNRSG
ncbi:hypothetical protein EJB05_40419, partial [Eragrostis curvula]